MFDPGDPAFLDDPYPEFARLRARAPVHDHPGLGLAVAVSHAACSAVLRHRDLGRIWRDAAPPERFTAVNLLHRHSLLENEPPTHTRLRRAVAGAFARGHVERLRPGVEAVAAELVGDLAAAVRDGVRGDLVETVARPLPILVIADLLGVPRADGPMLVGWSNAIVKMYEYGLPEAARDAAERAAADFVAYLRGHTAARAHRPARDLLTDLTGADLSPDEVVATAVLLLMAGHEATVNVVGNGVHALLTHPDQWRRLVADPSLVVTAVDELVRFDAPLQLFERTALVDVEIAGVRVPAGRKIAALLGAAARDPVVFADPDTLDVGRPVGAQLGFGAGVHYCLGAPLARLEIAAALRALVTTLPGLTPAGTPTRRPEFVMRGLSTLRVFVSA